jgi:hypothetical protein
MSEFQARWISKKQTEQARKSGGLKDGLLLSSFKGYIIVEPRGSRLGDGALLSPTEQDFELRCEWCQEPKGRIVEARKRLGLSAAI